MTLKPMWIRLPWSQDALRSKRLLARDGISRALAESMIDAQATREQRLAIADDVIDNSADLDSLDEAVTLLHRKYLELAD
jgi:dephospho-CoA kinase